MNATVMKSRDLFRHSTICTALAAAGIATSAQAQFSFTLFHNSDGESALINAPGQVNFGGVARFKTKLDQLRSAAGANVLTLNVGDMFLAGSQLDASLSNPSGPFYDAVAVQAMGYDTMTLGNHEFDFGPAVTRRYIDSFTNNPRFLSSNLNFSGEPQLAPLTSGPNQRLFRSSVVNVGSEQVGVIGAIYEQVGAITTLGGVTAEPVVAAVQGEINSLRASGVNKIVLASHLQSITEELALIPQLDGIDVVVAGGGEELMANPGTLLVAGDTRPATLAGIPNQYPLIRQDSTGKNVALVSTAGKYKYIGQLGLSFDNNGDLQSASGNPVRVAATSVGDDGVDPDSSLLATVVAPVQQHIAGLAANRIARSSVPLDGRRSSVRTRETNQGNLAADSIRWQAAKTLSESGPPVPTYIIALQNGGGLRLDTIIPAATSAENNISRQTVFDIFAFNNFLAIARDITPTKIKQLLEHSVGSNQTNPGQFGQWSGLSFSYNPAAPTGSRVVRIVLEDGTVVFDPSLFSGDGFNPAAPNVALASIDFLFAGGDNYPLTDLTFNRLGTTYRDAFENYVRLSGTFGGLAALNGVIDSSRYPDVGVDTNPFGIDPGRRIDVVPEPVTVGLLAGGSLVLMRRRRKC